MNVLLISTYELGRQPFGLASPAAWLREAGALVTCLDLSRTALDESLVRAADLIAFHLPMHTATRIASELIPRVRDLNLQAHICCYGLYAPMNEAYLRGIGVATILGGEFEEGLVSLVGRLSQRLEQGLVHGTSALTSQPEPVVSTARQRFRVPDRTGLPQLDLYAKLDRGDGENALVGYTETTRGCKYMCRHCPIVPVYKGRFRVVQREIVLSDIRQQIGAGASHITFGDPDFFNGPGHSLAIVEALHREYPDITYDVTIKVEHLLKYAHHLRTLRDTGCVLVTSAAESMDDHVLRLLDKGHTRDDFIQVVDLCRDAQLNLSPTFVPFTPWTSLESYLELLQSLRELGLAESVSPVQLAIRLLIPAGSLLLNLPELRDAVASTVDHFDAKRLSYPWKHKDERVDKLHKEVLRLVSCVPVDRASRRFAFSRIAAVASEAAGASHDIISSLDVLPARASLPYINESWFC